MVIFRLVYGTKYKAEINQSFFKLLHYKRCIAACDVVVDSWICLAQPPRCFCNQMDSVRFASSNIDIPNDNFVRKRNFTFCFMDEVFDDLNLIEVENGAIYLTSLYNFAQPLIRYRISDHLASKEPLAGSPFTRAEILLGRDEDIRWFEDGKGGREFQGSPAE